MLVSRDTSDLNDSQINKATIETYAENLSDELLLHFFLSLCFGIVGAFIL